MLWNNVSITEHNRQSLSVSVDRIENMKRMANGTMRKYVIADKRKWSTSWDSLPDVTSATVDGKEGGLYIENFYNTTPGAFTLKIMPIIATALDPITLTDAGDLITTTTPHKFQVGDTIQLGTITSTTGVTVNTTYYVKTIPTDYTLTLSATSGGATLTLTTNGTTTNLSHVYTVMITDFGKTIKKRGRVDEYDVDITLEEV